MRAVRSALEGLRSLKGIFNVLGHRQVWKECIILEHGVDVAFKGCSVDDVLVTELEAACGGEFEAGNHT